MIEVVPLSFSFLEQIISVVERKSLDFFEYRFLTDDELKSYLYNVLSESITENGSNTFVAVEGEKPLGHVSVSRNNFDSQFFGFPCFQFSIQTYSYICEDVKKTTKVLIDEAENSCKKENEMFYVYLGLNNNVLHSQKIFNGLISSGFYFINTLLTFSLVGKKPLPEMKPEMDFEIRTARPEDAAAVAALAQKSFKYSRFHLDPYLNDQKANLLLKTSAENSILKGFVDVMFVAEKQNKIIGYYGGKKEFMADFNKTFGYVTTTAVDADYQGLGIYTQLDNHALNWFSNTCDFAEMGTYLGNTPMHRTWIGKQLVLTRGTYMLSKFFNPRR